MILTNITSVDFQISRRLNHIHENGFEDSSTERGDPISVQINNGIAKISFIKNGNAKTNG